jgi:hypothetical protein
VEVLRAFSAAILAGFALTWRCLPPQYPPRHLMMHSRQAACLPLPMLTLPLPSLSSLSPIYSISRPHRVSVPSRLRPQEPFIDKSSETMPALKIATVALRVPVNPPANLAKLRLNSPLGNLDRMRHCIHVQPGLPSRTLALSKYVGQDEVGNIGR